MGQLADAKARLAQGAAEEEQSKVKLAMSEKELVNLEARMKTFAKEAGDNVKKLENLKANVQACQAKMTDSGWSVEKDKQLDMQLREARETVKNLHDVRISRPQLNDDTDRNGIIATRTRQAQNWKIEFRL